jgi:hypothetical protein
MSDMLFYERVVALNNTAHVALRVSPVTDFRFAAKTNSVPLLAGEFADAAREYPIAFVNTPTGLVPAALLGLRENENLFISVDGKWDARYIPAYVRRYPFVSAQDATGQLLVCIDEAAPCLGSTKGEPLFAGGKPAPQLDHAMQFLQEFQQGVVATEAVTARIEALGLLRDADSLARLDDGREFRLNGLRVVDEGKLRELDREVVLELFANGALGLIYAHLLSLGNLGRLVDRLSRRKDAPPISTYH